jgi:hypothetical protein
MTAMTFVIGLTGSASSALAEPTDPATIAIRVLNQAKLSQEDLLRATTEATRIFNNAGLNVVWQDAAGSGPERLFTVNIVPNVPAERSDFTSRHVLGMAPGTREMRGVQAWAFYAPIQARAMPHGVIPALLLGHVIAHEIGHLLLPDIPHSRTGLMREGWDKLQLIRASARTLTFTPAESALIRRTLRITAANP